MLDESLIVIQLTKPLPASLAFMPGGSFAAFNSATKVTTSDFPKLEDALHKPLITTIKCFCRKHKACYTLHNITLLLSCDKEWNMVTCYNCEELSK